MFSNIAFLFLIKNLFIWPSFLPPIAFLKSISACLPIFFLISAIKGVTVLFFETLLSSLDFKVLTVFNTLFLIAVIVSVGSVLLFNMFLYFGLSALGAVVSSTATFSAASKPLVIPSSTDLIPNLSAKLLALKKALFTINFSISCLSVNSSNTIDSISERIDSWNICLLTFFLASTAMGSYKALVLLVTTLSTIGLISCNTLFSNLVCLAPFIKSLPNFLAKASPSDASFFISVTSDLSWASCSGVNCLLSLIPALASLATPSVTKSPLTPLDALIWALFSFPLDTLLL